MYLILYLATILTKIYWQNCQQRKPKFQNLMQNASQNTKYTDLLISNLFCCCYLGVELKHFHIDLMID